MIVQKLPDGPQATPLQQTIQWTLNPLKYLETCFQQYGDIFTLRIGPVFTPQVIVSKPEAIQQIFAADSHQLESGAAAGIRSPLLGMQSLLSLEGEKHQRQRKLLMPPLHGERMRTYGQLIVEITQQVTKDWKIGETVTLLPAMQEISFLVILKAVFGLESGERFEQLKETLMAILNPKNPLIAALPLLVPALRQDWGKWSPWGSFLHLLRQIDQLIYREIEERRTHPNLERTDILSLMMAARDEAGQPMTDVELRDELMTLLVAGHETTASTLAWAFYWIHATPGVQEKLLAELQTLGDYFDYNAITKLPYLNAVCCETQRIYPVAIFALNRVVKSPLTIMDYQLEPGTLVVPCIYLTHHRQELYPDSKKFKPERFLDRQFSPFEYLPFGGGNRRCIGTAFALFEMKLVLATLLSSWEIELANQEPILPKRSAFLIRPAGGVPIVLRNKMTAQVPLSMSR
jgi:cytochrome P450